MNIELPELCLVALIGVSGSGKSTFAKTHFQPTVKCRGQIPQDHLRPRIHGERKAGMPAEAIPDKKRRLALAEFALGRNPWNVLSGGNPGPSCCQCIGTVSESGNPKGGNFKPQFYVLNKFFSSLII
jgi:hypothetical protein